MIRMLTGALGTGKTMWCVDQLTEVQEQNEKHKKNGDLDKVRQIYSNIDGLKLDHLPLPEDWRTCPKNSIFVIDECHKIDMYKPSRKVLHDDERIIALNESRHEGTDFYFITQSPKFLHQHIRGLVGEHYHFYNPMGMQVATVFKWRHGNTTTPDSQAAKNTAETSFIYSYNKKIFELYDSVTEGSEHTKKRSIPKKVIAWAVAPVVLICVVVLLLLKPETLGNLTGKSFTKSAEKVDTHLKNNQIVSNTNQTTASTSQQKTTELDQKIKNCQVQFGWSEGMCRDAYDKDFHNKVNQQTTASSNMNTSAQTVSYSPDRPYDLDNANAAASYQIVNSPKFSGCMKYGKKIIAVTEQGTLLKVKRSDCEKLLESSSNRPYDYFGDHKEKVIQQTQIQQTQTQTQTQDDQKQTQVRSIPDNSVFKGKDITKPSI